MIEAELPRALRQAPTIWKWIAYFLAAPALALLLYCLTRLIYALFVFYLLATENIAEPGIFNGSALFLVICYPIMIMAVPFLGLGLPYYWLRDATIPVVRNLIIFGLCIFVLTISLSLFAPAWSYAVLGI